MPWERRDQWDEGLLGYLRVLIRARHEFAALRRGATTVSAPADGLVVVERRLEEEPPVWVVVNVGEGAAAVPTSVVPAGRYRDVLSGDVVEQAEGALVVAGRGGVLITPA